MTALEKKPVTVKDFGLVQGLLVVAAQLKKYGRDGLDTNGACAAAPSLQLRCRLVAEPNPQRTDANANDPTADPSACASPDTTLPNLLMNHDSESGVAGSPVPGVPRHLVRGFLLPGRARVRRARVARPAIGLDRHQGVRHHARPAGRRRKGEGGARGGKREVRGGVLVRVGRVLDVQDGVLDDDDVDFVAACEEPIRREEKRRRTVRVARRRTRQGKSRRRVLGRARVLGEDRGAESVLLLLAVARRAVFASGDAHVAHRAREQSEHVLLDARDKHGVVEVLDALVLQLRRVDGQRRRGELRVAVHRDADSDRTQGGVDEARASKVHGGEQLLQNRRVARGRAGQRRPAHRRRRRRVRQRGGVSVRALVQAHPGVHVVADGGGEGAGVLQTARAVRRADLHHRGAAADVALARAHDRQRTGARGRVQAHARAAHRARRGGGAPRRRGAGNRHLGRWFEEFSRHAAVARVAAHPQVRRR